MSATAGPQFYIDKLQGLEYPGGATSADVAFILELLNIAGGGSSPIITNFIALATAAGDTNALAFLNAAQAAASQIAADSGAAAQQAVNAATSASTAATLAKRDANGSAAFKVVGLGSVNVSNLASGGSVGTAASTVDVATVLQINQTTAAQTLTIPNPTTASTVRTLIVANVGSASFTMASQTVAAGGILRLVWLGSSWVVG